MIAKLIKVNVKPGHLDQYLAAQEVWNRETRSAPGYLGHFCGRSPDTPDVVYLQFFWRSRDDLDRWMLEDHDRIAALAGADAHYERVEVCVLDPVAPTGALPPGFFPERTLEAADIQMWSEAYRTSAALRIGVRLGLFDKLADGPVHTDQLASHLDVEANHLHTLLLALLAMGFLTREHDEWRNTGLAKRYLVKGAAAYQGDMVLHNTQPVYIDRVFAFGERLGLPPDIDNPGSYHERFLEAMANTAAAGQADALVEVVDLTGCRTMLDIGGATGSYAMALCRAYPDLHVVVLDQPETLRLATPILEGSGFGDRVRIRAHDYGSGSFPGPVDAVLISNVLRGEPSEMVHDILKRAWDALAPGGRILIPDLYLDEPPANPGLRAALFGLHLPAGANLSMSQMARAVADAGFEAVRMKRLTRFVVMNGIVEARRPG